MSRIHLARRFGFNPDGMALGALEDEDTLAGAVVAEHMFVLQVASAWPPCIAVPRSRIAMTYGALS